MTEKINVGGVEVWALLDMIPPAYTPDDFFPSIPLDWWEPYRKEVFGHRTGNLQLYYGCFAVRSQGKLILVDTGMGPGPHPERGNRRGELTQRMKEEGLAPEDVGLRSAYASARRPRRLEPGRQRKADVFFGALPGAQGRLGIF